MFLVSVSVTIDAVHYFSFVIETLILKCDLDIRNWFDIRKSS